MLVSFLSFFPIKYNSLIYKNQKGPIIIYCSRFKKEEKFFEHKMCFANDVGS